MTVPRYFDHAATTPLDPRAMEAMMEYAREPMNASSIHRPGQRSRRVLDDCRARLARVLNVADPSSIVFTSGATEAANLALRGSVSPDMVVHASKIEHSCVRDTVEVLRAARAADARGMTVDEGGRAVVDAQAAGGLLCLMHGNNETGVIQDFDAARAWKLRTGGVWLCDASQSLGKVPLDLAELGADLVVLSSHKAYGPVGVGCLGGPGVKRIVPQITGGPQEDEKRAGTQPVALIAGFVRAAELAVEELASRAAHLRVLEEVFMGELRSLGIEGRVNGAEPRLPGFLNISFPGGLDATDVVIALDQLGFAVSPGSACSTGVVALSPVLEAMFPGDRVRAAGGVRFTFGKDTRAEDATELARAIRRILPARSS